jgi:hypothetical protein
VADAIHRTNRDYRGYLLRVFSINTPEYSTDDWLINPDLSGVSGVPEYYWKVTGTPPAGAVEEMSTSEKDSVDADRLSDAKTVKKVQLVADKESYLNSRYQEGDRKSFNAMYSKGLRKKPNRMAYVEPFMVWIEQVDQELIDRQNEVDSAVTITEISSIELDTATLDSADPGISISGALSITDANDLDNFLDSNAEVTDDLTGLKGNFHLMQTLENRRELFNDAENPIYHSSITPILGAEGHLEDHASRILNIEDIHAKHGWHNCKIKQAYYKRPLDLLIYYGYPNSFNSGINVWNNELVAQDMAKYQLIVLGDGVQDPGHADYSNTAIIIPRIKELNPRANIFGYVSSNQAIGDFQTKVDQWDTLAVHGILMDESGYDFGVDRSEFNTRVDYVHGKSNASICFANAWNTDHILGITDDANFPNSTYNPSEVESNLNENDWILLESWPINTSSYTGTGGYESASDWYVRGQKIVNLRATYHVNFAGSSVINNDNAEGQDLANFAFISSLMYSLEGFGTSDTSYGAGATVALWSRPDTSNMGVVWELYPGVQQDVADTDKYHRYSQTAKMTLDFSSGSESSSITKW